MKSITVIGSAITKHVVDRIDEGFVVKNHFLSINPLSFVKDCTKQILDIPHLNTEAYAQDLNKDVFNILAESKPDYVLIDLLDCRLNVEELLIAGEKRYATLNNGLNKYLENVDCSKIREINAMDVSFDEWQKCFATYYEKLLKIFSAKQIILLKVKSAFACFSKHDRFYYMLNEKDRTNLNDLYERVYDAFISVAKDIQVIPCPEPLFCDEYEFKKFTFSLTSIYYEYAARAVKDCISGGVSVDLSEKCKECSAALRKRAGADQPIENVWQDVTLNDFSGNYTDDFGNQIVNLSNDRITVYLKGGNNSVVVEQNCSLTNTSFFCESDNNIRICSGNVITNTRVVAKKRNKLIVKEKNKLLDINVTMIFNSKISIGEENVINKVDFTLFGQAGLTIGNNNSLVSRGSEFRGHDYTETIVGDDTLWSQNISVLNGDGHSIFDIETKQKINDMSAANNGKNKIHIDNHVWVGHSVTILKGTCVGEGSIIGANSLVTKRFPNNCIISGVPAKIAKKNICWCRSNSADDIAECMPYIHNTEE